MHPVLFNIGDTPIHAYGFLIAVALIVGWVLSLKLARDDKLPADQLGTAYVLAVAGGLIGGRAMWLTQESPAGLSDWMGRMVQLEAGGLSGFGGVMVGLIVAGLYCQNKKIPTWAWLDCAAPAFLIGVVLERVAAFLSGADFGHYADPDLFMAVQYPVDSPVYQIQRRDLTGLPMSPELSLPVHPSQLYAAAAAALGLVIVFWIRKRRRYSGQMALFALGYYGVVRYVIEDPFRYDATPELVGPVSLGLVTGLVIGALAVAGHVSRMAKLAEDPGSVVQWTGGPWTPGADAPKSGAGSGAGKKKSSKKKSSKKADTAAKSEPQSEPAAKVDPSKTETKPD